MRRARARRTRFHSLAALCCLTLFLAANRVAVRVFEEVPHLEDEAAFLFQAQVFARGRVSAPTPPHPECFSSTFVVDYRGQRFGKYPPGWPALLALGVTMGQPWWVNAACAALSVALIFRLGRELHGPATGALAAALATTSPFVLLLAGSLMSHTACLVFVAAFLWSFRRAWARAEYIRRNERLRWAWAAGAALGGAFLIRPFTAVAVALPAGLYALWRLARRGERRRAVWLALGFAPPALLLLAFNARWTGDPFLSPYTLAWPFDRLGFGPGHGVPGHEHTLLKGLGNVVYPIWLLSTHLHGWPALSLVFVIFLLASRPRRFWDLFLASGVLSLALAHGFYWAGCGLFGPRYLYEGAAALFILSAAGIVRAGRRARRAGGRRWRAFCALLALLMAVNLFAYLPRQFRRYHGLYGITAAPRKALEQADLHNALVIVQGERWEEYAVPFAMNSPTLDGEVVYARDCAALQDDFSGRQVYYFDAENVRLYGFDP